MKKIYPPQVFLVCLLGTVACWWFLPEGNLVLFPLVLVGVLPLGAGIWLLVAGSTLFVRVGTNILPYNKPDRLVTDGPFRLTRNPMYLGFVSVLIGVSVLLGNVFALAFAVLFFLWIQFWNIPFEERLCEEVFGDEYLAYKRSVRRWI